MAEKIEDMQRVRVSITQQELNTLLVEPAKQRGFIDFNPTRIHTRPLRDGNFEITFERNDPVTG